MRRLALLALTVAACSGNNGHDYGNSDEELSASFTAKSMCSCLFVMGQPEAYCRIWAHQDPAVATYKIDRGAKAVQASTLMFWGSRARYQGPKYGCTLE